MEGNEVDGYGSRRFEYINHSGRTWSARVFIPSRSNSDAWRDNNKIAICNENDAWSNLALCPVMSVISWTHLKHAHISGQNSQAKRKSERQWWIMTTWTFRDSDASSLHSFQRMIGYLLISIPELECPASSHAHHYYLGLHLGRAEQRITSIESTSWSQHKY